MKAIMIAGPNSGSGKTVFSLALNRALANRGVDVSAFKTGPDYIDPMYHSIAARKTCGNLDIHMQTRKGLGYALALSPGELAVIEGAMGYFDGIGNGFEASSYDIGCELGVNSILIYTPKGEMFTMIPKIRGMIDFSKGRIVGVILNKVNQGYCDTIKDKLEGYCGIKMLGCLPEDSKLSLPHRYLGLIQPNELEDVDELIERASSLVESNVDLDSLIDLATDIEPVAPVLKKHKVRVAVARDEAFGFHYNENLKILEEMSEKLSFFSPMHDENLPEADLVIIGGGYPELYLEELGKNTSMMEQIREFSMNGGYILGMGGGLIYLSNSIDGTRMTGVIEGVSKMTNRVQRFGYVEITQLKDTILGKAGLKLRAKEFHKSTINAQIEPSLEIAKSTGASWNCGYMVRNTLGLYQHLNFAGCTDMLEALFERLEERNVYKKS